MPDEVSQTDLAYLAGLLDGEGCVYINDCRDSYGRRYFQLRVVIANTHQGVLVWARKIFPGIKSSLTTSRARRDGRSNRTPENWRRSHHLSWNSSGAATVLSAVYPYLKIKKGEAEVALRFQATIKKPGQRSAPEIWAAREEMKATLQAMKRVES